MKYQRIAVYGTLKKGYSLYDAVLKDCAEFLGAHDVPNYTMYKSGVYTYPIVCPEEKGKVFTQVYSIPHEVFMKLHQLEAAAGYYDAEVETPWGPACMWVQSKPREGWYRHNVYYDGAQVWI